MKIENCKLKIKERRGFTLIELLVSVTIIAVLSGIILFSVTQYIDKSKDSSISANLAILIPAGEVYYNANNGNGYLGFCNSDVARNAQDQMPKSPDSQPPCGNEVGFCCVVSNYNQSWAACVKKYADSSKAFCVDSRGVKKDIDNSYCSQIGAGSVFKCQQ